MKRRYVELMSLCAIAVFLLQASFRSEKSQTPSKYTKDTNLLRDAATRREVRMPPTLSALLKPPGEPTPPTRSLAVCDRAPSANGSRLSWRDAREDGVDGEWADYTVLPGKDVAMQLEVRGCNLSSIGATYARECLRGKHIVFMGDSLTRYQYIHLVTMLAGGSWAAHSASPFQSVNEKSWGNWTDFYKGTNARLKGLEVCDCFRLKGDNGPGVCENRYFFDPTHNVRVTFISFLNTHRMRHHPLDWLNVTCNGPLSAPWRPGQAKCTQSGCIPGECAPDAGRPDLEYGAPYESIVKWAAELAPVNAMFINSGLWGDFTKYPEVVDELRKAGREVREKGLVKRMFWKMTTAPEAPITGYDAPGREYPLLSTLEGDGWERYDSWALTVGAQESAISQGHEGKAFWDLVHLNPAIYRGLNQALLADLCWNEN